MSSPNWADWAWERRDQIAAGLLTLFTWLWRRKGAVEEGPDVLVIGPGGVGKSTLGRILSGKFDLLLDMPGDYDESLEVETYALKDAPDVEVVVPPGQPHRRDTWESLFAALAAGEYRGIILLTAYGYHNHGIGPTASYKDHPLYQGDKDAFLKAFLGDRRREELDVLRQLVTHVKPKKQGKLWFLTLVTKQDLWWQERGEVESHYRQGEWSAELKKIQAQQGAQLFRYELSLASLVISNFTTGKGEVLKPNTAGYDHAQHARSLRRVFETLDALRRWEVDT